MIRNIFGGTIAGFGCLVWGIWGIVGLLVNLGVVHDAIGWGFFGVILAFILTIAKGQFKKLLKTGYKLFKRES